MFLFGAWRTRIPTGERPRSTVNFKNSASLYPKEVWLGIYDACGAVAIRASGGLPFFLHNHREAIVAFDFFTVPTVTFQLLYCFFVIAHGRRQILHCNVTRYPTAEWVMHNCVRPSRKPAHTATSSSTGTANSMLR